MPKLASRGRLARQAGKRHLALRELDDPRRRDRCVWGAVADEDRVLFSFAAIRLESDVLMLTKKGKYGLKAMVDLAQLQPGETAFITEIAVRNNLPKKFLDT